MPSPCEAVSKSLVQLYSAVLHGSLQFVNRGNKGIIINCLQQLWSLVVENADFLYHLRSVKDFFLLSRGELFLAFIDKAHSMLCVPTSATTERGTFSAKM